jgi:hypothetical protein
VMVSSRLCLLPFASSISFDLSLSLSTAVWYVVWSEISITLLSDLQS